MNRVDKIVITDHAMQRFRERTNTVIPNCSCSFIKRLVAESTPCGFRNGGYHWWHAEMSLVFVTVARPHSREQTVVTVYSPNDAKKSRFVTMYSTKRR